MAEWTARSSAPQAYAHTQSCSSVLSQHSHPRVYLVIDFDDLAATLYKIDIYADKPMNEEQHFEQNESAEANNSLSSFQDLHFVWIFFEYIRLQNLKVDNCFVIKVQSNSNNHTFFLLRTKFDCLINSYSFQNLK